MSDMATLFAKDPLSLTRDDRNEIVKYFREARANFDLGEKQAGSKKKINTPKGKIKNLDDLDIDL